MIKDTPESKQLLKFAEDLQKIYKSEKDSRLRLEDAHKQLKKFAEALNKTILELKQANIELKDQVKVEEREKLMQRKLIQANKMTSLGTMASGIAHEINNPVNFILANTQMLVEIWGDLAKILDKIKKESGDVSLGGLSLNEMVKEVPRMLNGNLEGTRRVSKILSGLKDYTRGEMGHQNGTIDINEVIKFSINILNNQIKKFTNSFQLELGKNLPMPRGDSQQIEQVVINILQNSLQALPDKSCGVQVISRFNRRVKCVEIIIKDEGTGMKKETLSRITEPFFTTRRDSGGTGLGLYISYTIIKEHRGTLDIKSEQGIGTEIIVSFPVPDRE
jgi:signal transduction histidine kinase